MRKTARVNPINIAKQMGKSRQIHFKDVDAALSYREKFGAGTTSSNVYAYLEHAARNAGAMEKFGPNPELMMESLGREWSHKIAHNESISARKIGKKFLKISIRPTGASLSNALRGTIGLNDVPGNSFQAQLWASTRGVISMAKLGAGRR